MEIRIDVDSDIKKVVFGNISVGECFKANGEYCIRIERIHGSNYVNLNNGTLGYYTSSYIVTKPKESYIVFNH